MSFVRTAETRRHWAPQATTSLQTVHSVTQYANFTKAFFTSKNATQFHSTHMNVIMLMQKVWPSINRFS